jgi:hypothetical protein
MSSQFGLLKARRFAPFFGTQFLGAFNDNLYKNALVVLLTFQAASWTTLTPEVLTNLAPQVSSSCPSSSSRQLPGSWPTSTTRLAWRG